MNLNLERLNYTFMHKPLLVGGKAMEYYGLRQAGADIDFIIHPDDHAALCRQYPDHIKDLYGDIGVCEFEFEIWNRICTFGYDFLRPGAIEEADFLAISLEKLLFLKAMAMHIPKYHRDVELIVERIKRDAYAALG